MSHVILLLISVHLAELTVKEGQVLLDLLSMLLKNAFGEDVTPDYTRDKARLNQMLNDLQERKLRYAVTSQTTWSPRDLKRHFHFS